MEKNANAMRRTIFYLCNGSRKKSKNLKIILNNFGQRTSYFEGNKEKVWLHILLWLEQNGNLQKHIGGCLPRNEENL